jgi:DNA-binding response OmpR family regulator
MSGRPESEAYEAAVRAESDEESESQPSAAEAEAPSGELAATAPAVLVVDDNERLARTVATFMEMQGFSSRAAFSAEEALTAAAAARFDVAVIDINMPGMDGIEVCRRIMAASPAVRVLMLTGRDADDDRHKAASAGARRLLSKPIPLSALCEEVRQVLAE